MAGEGVAVCAANYVETPRVIYRLLDVVQTTRPNRPPSMQRGGGTSRTSMQLATAGTFTVSSPVPSVPRPHTPAPLTETSRTQSYYNELDQTEHLAIQAAVVDTRRAHYATSVTNNEQRNYNVTTTLATSSPFQCLFAQAYSFVCSYSLRSQI